MADINGIIQDKNSNSCYPKTFDYNVYNSNNQSLDNIIASMDFDIAHMAMLNASNLTSDNVGDWKNALNVANFKLLWSNSNSSNDFNAQTINLSSSDYDILMIICSCRKYNNANTQMITCFMKKGDPATVAIMLENGTDSSYKVERWSRVFKRTNDTQLSAQAAYYAQNYNSVGSTNNTLMIPCYIYGIKIY